MGGDVKRSYQRSQNLDFRKALGGFYVPSEILRVPKSDKDSVYRYTFHGFNLDSNQEPGHPLSQDQLSRPLTGLGQVLWIKVKGYEPFRLLSEMIPNLPFRIAPIKNMATISTTSMEDSDDE
ncbi:hypothetical protein IW262DRAFT_1295635 [Armillaria fumosa]|nr:hypothetical protein IW262DRAFT_1295635 [Armillaria fumosa]